MNRPHTWVDDGPEYDQRIEPGGDEYDQRLELGDEYDDAAAFPRASAPPKDRGREGLAPLPSRSSNRGDHPDNPCLPRKKTL